jgi:ferrous iron transport protein B
MKKIVLMGNPNVGKSVVFSRLTGAEVITSNYPGTSVDFSRGRMLLGGESVEIADAPGTYSLEPSNRAEEVALSISERADTLINVVDATNLERNLFLTLELLEMGKPIIVALNLWDEAVHTGIEIDVPELERLLGVPVVPTIALSGEGIRILKNQLENAHPPADRRSTCEDEKWVEIGHIVKQVQRVTHRHPGLRERVAEASIRPLTGIPLAIVVVILAFILVREIGEGIIVFVFDPLFELYLTLAMDISDALGPGFMHDILIGRLIEGEIDYVQSMGILTTGIYVPFGMVLPYIVGFYIMIAIMEDSGYLPRLATLSDNLFHRLGMHGYGIIPVFLGLGCNVPGALATRVLETRKQRFISATLMAIAVPCMAKTAMIFGVLGPYGLSYVLLVLVTLGIVYVAIGFIINSLVKGECPEICLEIPPYRRPYASAVAKKTWMRVRGFLYEAIPYLFLGVLLVNIMYAVGFLEWLGSIFAPLMEQWLGLPSEAVTALLVGFLRKDLAVGMLIPLGMTPFQLVIAITTLTMFFPCVGTFSVLIKELGIRDTVLSVAVMVATAFTVGGLMRFILLGF